MGASNRRNFTTYYDILESRFVTRVGEPTNERVDPATKTAETRQLKKGDKLGWWVIEEQFTHIEGIITGIKTEVGNFGLQLFLTINDNGEEMIIRTSLKGNYGSSFVKRLPNIDLKKEVELSPYNFTNDEGKRVSGLTVKQNGEKIYSKFTKDDPGDCPAPKQKKTAEGIKWDWDDQIMFLRDLADKYGNDLNAPDKIDEPVPESIEAADDLPF